MLELLTGWLAKKAVAIGVTALALLGLVLIPVAAAQYVQIHGFWFFGEGLKAEAARLHQEIDEPVTGYRARLSAALGRANSFETGLNTCNASVDALHKQGAQDTAAAEARLAAERAKSAALNQRVGALLAAKSTGDICHDADALILEGVQ